MYSNYIVISNNDAESQCGTKLSYILKINFLTQLLSINVIIIHNIDSLKCSSKTNICWGDILYQFNLKNSLCIASNVRKN